MANTAPLALAGILFLLPQTQVEVQAQPSSLTFEVATVRHSGPVSGDVPPIVTGGPRSRNPTQVSYSMMPLRALLSIAYGVRTDQIKGPGWMATERYDIVAKIPFGATQAQFTFMLQNLLRVRFNMRFHLESEIRPAYTLTVGKNGTKLKASSAPRETSPGDKPLAIGTPDDKGYPMLPPTYTGVVGQPRLGHMYLAGQRASVSDITYWLQTPLDRPIVDRTGLTGAYDFKMDFEWPRREGASAPTEPVPSVFSAVEDYLGLRLEGGNVPFDIVVIDSMDTEPTEN